MQKATKKEILTQGQPQLGRLEIMNVTYILQSESSGKFYIGSTSDLDRRLAEHLRGHSLSTRHRGPWKLVHTEHFGSLLEARRRELQIKGWKSSKTILALLKTTAG
jgi:putative endonuclease